MSAAWLDFTRPWALWLLPLALWPLLRGRRDALRFAAIAWLPRDRAGQALGLAWRLLALLAIAAVVFGLAGPGRPQGQVARVGHGAEIVVLMDRSRSMDERMLPADWRSIDPLNLRAQAGSRGEPKGKVARAVLSAFVAGRREDRFALMFFSASPLHVMPFTAHDEAVQAGIAAGGVGRGLADTDVGQALLAAIASFETRPYSGSRVILLVSDGGAQLDRDKRRAIAAGLQRQRIALNWIHLRSVNSPALDVADDASAAIPEVALHRFFRTLNTPYRVYEADVPEELAQAVADLGRQQNFPLDWFEQVPRRDFSHACLGLAAACCGLLLAYRAFLLRSFV